MADCQIEEFDDEMFFYYQTLLEEFSNASNEMSIDHDPTDEKSSNSKNYESSRIVRKAARSSEIDAFLQHATTSALSNDGMHSSTGSNWVVKTRGLGWALAAPPWFRTHTVRVPNDEKEPVYIHQIKTVSVSGKLEDHTVIHLKAFLIIVDIKV